MGRGRRGGLLLGGSDEMVAMVGRNGLRMNLRIVAFRWR